MVECRAVLMRYTRKGIVGSNPTLSAYAKATADKIHPRRRVRAVYGDSFENYWGCKSLAGSNPAASATQGVGSLIVQTKCTMLCEAKISPPPHFT